MISAHLNSLNSRERHREMLAQADRQRLARQLRELIRTSRRASRGTPGLGRARGTATALIRLRPRYRAAR
jgi:hypothetical protein